MSRNLFAVGLHYKGTRYPRLIECEDDAFGWGDQCKVRGISPTVYTDSCPSWADVRETALLCLRGSDLAVLMLSMHGYWKRVNKKAESGLLMQTPVPHATLHRELIVPLVNTCGTVVVFVDACFGGGARQLKVKSPQDITSTLYRDAPTVKCVTLDSTDTNGAEDAGDAPEIYTGKQTFDNLAVIAACGNKQVAFGAFRGHFGSRHGMNTGGKSFFTYNMIGCLAATTWLDLRTALSYMNFNCDAARDAFAPYRWWNGLGWPNPRCSVRIGRRVASNCLS